MTPPFGGGGYRKIPTLGDVIFIYEFYRTVIIFKQFLKLVTYEAFRNTWKVKKGLAIATSTELTCNFYIMKKKIF